MSANNGVIRVGRKGRKKFAFGEDGKPFEVDIIVVWQQWICLDETFRDKTEDRTIPLADMAEYHRAAMEFVKHLATDPAKPEEAPDITTTEALEFIARLREQYDEMVDFFRVKERAEPELSATSGAEMRFSVEEK